MELTNKQSELLQILLDAFDIEDKELELRFRNFDKTLFDKLVNLIKENKFGKYLKTHEQSVDIVSEIDKFTIRRQTIILQDGKKKSVDYLQKKKIRDVFVDEIKISLSEEKSIPKFSANFAKFARLKNRYSVVFDLFPDWRFDLTIVKRINMNEIPFLKTHIGNFFSSMKDFENVPINKLHVYEFEIEYIGKKKLKIEDIQNFYKKFVEIFNPDFIEKKKQQMGIYNIASYIVPKNILSWYAYKYNIKQLGNSPLNLDKKTYAEKVLPNIENYYLTDKADGERCLIFLSEKESYGITSNQKIPIDLKTETTIILDSEYFGDNFYIFDVLYFGKNLTNEKISARIKYFEDIKKIGKPLFLKPYVKLTRENYKQEITGLYKNSAPIYPIDGLIFVSDIERRDNYFKNITYKWKPADRLSIDFMLVKLPENLTGKKPFIIQPKHDIYLLYCGIRPNLFKKLQLTLLPFQRKLVEHLYTDNYFPTLFSPSDNPTAFIYHHPQDNKNLSYQIGEFSYKNDKWKLLKLRPDKNVYVELKTSFGNDFRVAELTWQSIKNPLNFEDLIADQIDLGYFSADKSNIYIPGIKFNSFVKGLLINNFADYDFVIDLAGGRGQDIGRLSNAKVKTTIFIDKDADAIETLNKRKYSFDTGMKILSMVLDLDRPFKENLKKIQETFSIEKVNGIMINFAIHYFCKDITTLTNLILLIDNLLIAGGRVIITCFNGKEVFSKLKDLPLEEFWNLHENNVLKYSIRRLFKDNAYSIYDKKIAVKLPFSGENYYEEYLVDIDNLIDLFEKKKYEIEINRSFKFYLDKFKQMRKEDFEKLSAIDKEYVSLYHAITFWKCV